MTRLTLVTTPNPILKMRSSAVEKVDKELQNFLDDMIDTMYHEDGAGIAAVQVGILKRIFILDVGRKDQEAIKDPIFFINPEIISYSDEKIVYNEGCLSFPGARSMISRPEGVKVRYLDYDGNKQEIEADGYLARGIFHENDHLNGVTMLNHMSPIKRDIFLRQIKKYARYNNDNSEQSS